MMFYDYFPLIVMLILDFSPNHNALCYIKLTKIFLNFKALQLGEISLNRTTFHNIKDLVTTIFPLIVIFPLFIMLLNRNTDCIGKINTLKFHIIFFKNINVEFSALVRL